MKNKSFFKIRLYIGVFLVTFVTINPQEKIKE